MEIALNFRSSGKMEETYFPLFLLGTTKISGHYWSTKHKKTLNRGEKKADQLGISGPEE